MGRWSIILYGTGTGTGTALHGAGSWEGYCGRGRVCYAIL